MILCQYPLARLVSQNAQTLRSTFDKRPRLIEKTEDLNDHRQSGDVIADQETASDLEGDMSVARTGRRPTGLTHIQASIASVRSVVLEEGLTTRVVHSSFSTRCKNGSTSNKGNKLV